MKILFLNRYQSRIERGAESFIGELSSRLSLKHSVDIFSDNKADSLKAVLKGKYDIVVPVNGRWQSLKVSLAKYIGGYKQSLNFSLRSKYKVLITGHSGQGWDDIWNIAVAKPDVFVALTDNMAAWARKWAWGSRVVKIPNGIDLSKFSPRGEKIYLDLPRPIILSCGALVWYKHHEKVIDAVSKMDEGSVLIVGEGRLKDELIKRANETLSKRFMILNVKHEDMPKIYRSVDLFTLPSWDREAFGIVYLEALASGLGIVAPDDATRREIIGEAGILINEKDSLIYAKALGQALRMNWENKARLQAEKFSWEKIARQYEQIMMEILPK
ncbi:glycosyltransferase family 4 protein [Candidatus Daviesbacteria bacterium]|nr:glycosyltransferase family 4 protein [Candidatus Daviesbacteria bacterium]